MHGEEGEEDGVVDGEVDEEEDVGVADHAQGLVNNYLPMLVSLHLFHISNHQL